MLDVLPAPPPPPRAPSTDEWYRTAAVQMAFFVIWVIDMEALLALLAFVFVLRPLLKYKRLRAVADEEEDVFIPSLSELLEPPEYRSPKPFGRSLIIFDLSCCTDDLVAVVRAVVVVVNVDSAEWFAVSLGL